MYLFVEMWNARPAWLSLSQSEREVYMANVQASMGELLAIGIEVVGWSVNRAETHGAPYHYFAVWKVPSPQAQKTFEQIIEQAGWYTYFEQTTLVGELSMPDAVIAQHIAQS